MNGTFDVGWSRAVRTRGMNKPMENQKEFLPSGHIRLYTEREADERKQNSSTRSHICLVCEGAGRLRIEVPYGDPFFGKSILCSCVEERQRSLRQQQRRQAAN